MRKTSYAQMTDEQLLHKYNKLSNVKRVLKGIFYATLIVNCINLGGVIATGSLLFGSPLTIINSTINLSSIVANNVIFLKKRKAKYLLSNSGIDLNISKPGEIVYTAEKKPKIERFNEFYENDVEFYEVFEEHIKKTKSNNSQTSKERE